MTLGSLTVTTALLAALLLAQPVMADPRGGDERHEHLDKRHGHGHSYPDRDSIVASAPRGSYRVRVGAERYWFNAGVWYHHDGAHIVVVDAPLGGVVPVLPPFYTTVVAGHVPYYYANDTYYVYAPREGAYQVVAPTLDAPPVAAAPAADFFAYPRTGQSPQLQATDRSECGRWATEQTGFDANRAPDDALPSVAGPRRSDYLRAISACLDARGYTVH